MGFLIILGFVILLFIFLKTNKKSKPIANYKKYRKTSVVNDPVQQRINDTFRWAEKRQFKAHEFIQYQQSDLTQLVKLKGKKNLTKRELEKYEQAKADQDDSILNHTFRPPYVYKLREARPVLRKAILDAIKEKDEAKINEFQNDLYCYAILETGAWGYSPNGPLYSDENCEKFGYLEPDEWLRQSYDAARRITYDRFGKITNCNYLSQSDWNRFEKYQGVSSRTIDSKEIRGIIERNL